MNQVIRDLENSAVNQLSSGLLDEFSTTINQFKIISEEFNIYSYKLNCKKGEVDKETYRTFLLYEFERNIFSCEYNLASNQMIELIKLEYEFSLIYIQKIYLENKNQKKFYKSFLSRLVYLQYALLTSKKYNLAIAGEKVSRFYLDSVILLKENAELKKFLSEIAENLLHEKIRKAFFQMYPSKKRSKTNVVNLNQGDITIIKDFGNEA